jgi:hypothetical protein
MVSKKVCQKMIVNAYCLGFGLGMIAIALTFWVIELWL